MQIASRGAAALGCASIVRFGMLEMCQLVKFQTSQVFKKFSSKFGDT
jgi:hypothetical protein